MSGVEAAAIVQGSEKLTNIFGYWPSFHDAEIIELNLWRGDVEPDEGRYVLPVLSAKIRLWELTQETDAAGMLKLRHETVATLQFHDVDDIEITGFNHQNAVFGLTFGIQERGTYTNGKPLPPYITVHFQRSFGVEARFKCLRAEVVSALPDKKGRHDA